MATKICRYYACVGSICQINGEYKYYREANNYVMNM